MDKLKNGGIDLNYKDINININAENIYKKISKLFLLMSPYAIIKGMGPGQRCFYKNQIIIKKGLNFFTLHSKPTETGRCSTYHHGVIYRIGDKCVKIDTWLASENECRDLDVQMYDYNILKAQLIELQQETNISIQEYILRSSLFKAPNKTKRFLTEKLYVGIWNGEKLTEMLMKYLNDEDKPSKLNRTNTIEANAKLKKDSTKRKISKMSGGQQNKNTKKRNTKKRNTKKRNKH